MMKKNDESENNLVSRDYSFPTMEIELIEIESGIAAGSATVLPPNTLKEVKEEWDNLPDDIRPIDW